MAFLQTVKHRMEILEMNDISELCVLGFLFDDARNLNGLINVIRTLDLGSWQPTGEVIQAAVERLLDSANVVQLEAGNDIYFSITGIGIKKFFALMKRAMPNNPRLRDTVLSLKSTFLETLPKSVGKVVVEELLAFYNCQLNCLENQCTNCPLRSQRGQIQNDRQLYHIKQELDWLQSITRNLEQPRLIFA